jgi:hypothetical protein
MAFLDVEMETGRKGRGRRMVMSFFKTDTENFCYHHLASHSLALIAMSGVDLSHVLFLHSSRKSASTLFE